MHLKPNFNRSLLVLIISFSLCLSGCLPEKPVEDTIRKTQTTPDSNVYADSSSFESISESAPHSSSFPTSSAPFLTGDDMISDNIGQAYVLSGVLIGTDRANSGSILLTISCRDFDCQVYFRSGLDFNAYSLTIGETYQIEGVLDEYRGSYEIIPEEPEDIIHDGQYDFESAKVVSIIDGDTVKVELSNGSIEKLRIIGVDAPETDKPDKPGEYYADEATTFISDLLLDQTIYLERDNSETDKYGRLLRYIWLEIPSEINEESISEFNVSALLLKDGYAEFIRVGDDDKYAGIFSLIDQSAQDDNLGMWRNK
jgi:endonuclease YncB( thermonuclease family)